MIGGFSMGLDLCVGFIGGGAMAEALVAGITQGTIDREHIFVSDHKAARCQELAERYGIHTSVGADAFVGHVDVLFLAVKPQAAAKAIDEVKDKVGKDTLILSIVAGLTLDSLEASFTSQPVVRIMPNTPLSVGAGMSAFACGTRAGAEEAKTVAEILSASGRAIEVSEPAMDAVTGLSGSGPAYVFLLIDALSDGGVAAGLKRDAATLLAAQTVYGAAKMVLETQKHPDVLRDQVTSPAGTTIAGVRVLENRGLRGALIDAVLAATEKSRELGKK